MQTDENLRYFQLPERQPGEIMPIAPLVAAAEAFTPTLGDCLRATPPLLEALGRNADADAFLIGVFRLLNRLDVELAEHDEGEVTVVDLLEYRRERAGS